MGALTQAAQLILSLSILIVLHELGHYIPARIFKTRIEKFYLFFDPWFSLFKVKKGETEYGIGWLPLGGYVKIAGMIDESMDKEQMKQPPQPWEFRSKPAWQRLIIMVGGVSVNVILAIFIYSMVLFTWGSEYLPTKNLKYGVSCDSLALRMGLQNGDKIQSIDHIYIDDFREIPLNIIENSAHSIQVNRNGSPVNIAITKDDISALFKNPKNFIQPRFPCVIDSVLNDSAAAQAGLLKGDSITGIDSLHNTYFQDVVATLHNNKGKQVAVHFVRNGVNRTVTAKVSGTGKLGFVPKNPADYFDFKTQHYGFFESFPAGVHKSINAIVSYAKSIKLIFTVKGAHKQLGGFIAIGKAYSPVWDWERFWAFTGFLSIMLAFLNILPIPALDGGHVMFLIYEVITGRKPNEKVMEYAQYVGMILLLALLIYVNGNDVMRLFHK